MRCAVCEADAAEPYRSVDGVAYFRCGRCGSLFAHPDFLARIEAGGADVYAQDYWQSELGAARERCFGAAVLRVAETIAYCRVPIRSFIDIGAGTGWLLDSLEVLLPEAIERFHAVELYPPPLPHRTANPNYVIGTLGDMQQSFDAGVCIEVIEHLTPATLRALVAQLAAASRPGSLYLFNSGQPDFVEREDPGYLDPHGRGHIVSYSLTGADAIFAPAGFNVIALPGRSWAFLAEFGPRQPGDADALIARLWHPVPENVSMLRSARFGELIRAAALDTARATLPQQQAPMSWGAYLRRGMRGAIELRGRV
jgi:SAM-dependent methyltransferase